MSPPGGTNQNAGSPREQSHQQREEDESRMQIDLGAIPRDGFEKGKAVTASAQALQSPGLLSLSADRGAALDEIEDGDFHSFHNFHSSIRRVNEGRQRAARSDPVATLERMIEESRRQKEAFNKAKADDGAATAQTPGSRPDKMAGTWSDCSQSGPGEGTKSPPRPPQKAPKSSADLEMLRLKDRQTLHRLNRS